MSLGDVLSGAVDVAGKAVSASAENLTDSTLASLSVQVKTNLGPAFTLGGTAPDPTAPPGAAPASTGLLNLLGVKFSATVLDASGHPLYTYGTPPPTNPLLVVLYLGGLVGFSFLAYRGIRSFWR